MLTFDRLAVALVFVAIAVVACLSPAQGDTWWHLRVGFDVWRTHHVFLTDSYSYTAAGAFFPNHAWLSDVIFAGLYKLGGFPLLTAGTALAILAAWGFSWQLADGPFEIALVALLGGVAASTVSWAIRPQVFSMAALALTCFLLTSGRGRFVPVVALVWANLHGAVLLGLVAVGGAVVAETIEKRRLPKMLLLVALGCVAATLLTPMGWRFWPELAGSLERSKANALIEWAMPGFTAVMWPFWAMVIALPVATFVHRRRIRGPALVLVVIALMLLPLAVRSVRNVAMFMLVAAPALTQVMRSEGDRRLRKQAERQGLNAAFLGGAAAIGAGIVALAWSAPAPQLGWRPIAPDAATAIAACPDPIYNTFEEGGAIIWFVPEKKVFIDNRQDPYPAELLHDARLVESTGVYRSLFERYGIKCAAVPTDESTAAALQGDTRWKVTYRDREWTVFTER